MWHPDRKQWQLIWVVYSLALIFSVDWTKYEERWRPPTTPERVQEEMAK
jgi:hypothetical protein